MMRQALKHRPQNRLALVPLILFVAFLAYTPSATPERTTDKHDPETALLWQEPTDIGSRDLFYGPGGKERMPADGPFTFVEEDTSGTTPKFVVTDTHGDRWKAKLGDEAHTETAATRLVWAAGYFADENYFLSEITVQGLPPQLKRGQDHVSGAGMVKNVRLERVPEDQKKVGSWKWMDPRWQNRRDWNGLRTLMAVLNNWDVKDVNTAVYEVREPSGQVRYIYAVSDLGHSFGPDHIDRERTKQDIDDYRDSKFIRKVDADTIDFTTPGPPSLFFALNPFEYTFRHRLTSIGRDIPRTDARWIGQLLSQLTTKQIQDAFRAAGFPAGEIEDYAKVVEQRVRILAEI
jgi:hypothetical protein